VNILGQVSLVGNLISAISEIGVQHGRLARHYLRG